jgi:uncharacterized lipoprotein YmbA
MKIYFPIVLVVISLVGGCIIPESNHVEPEYHLLVSLSSDDNETLHLPDLSFYVREVSIPPYLDDSRFARRENTSSLSYEENHRWGEPLGEGISRVVGLNLSSILGSLSYSSYPSRARNAATYEISLSVLQFERVERFKVRVVAVVEIFHRNSLQSQFKVDELISIDGSRVENETRALSVALDEISKIISSEIFELPLSQCMLIKISEVDYRNASLDQLVKELSSHFMSNTNSDQQFDNVIRLASGFDHSTPPTISIAEQDVTLLDLINKIQRKTDTTLKFSRTEIIFVPLP